MHHDAIPQTQEFRKQGYLLLSGEIVSEVCQLAVRYARMKEDLAFNPESAGEQVPGTHSVYADALMESLLEELRPRIEMLTGLKLFPTYAYYRVYRPGDELKPHRDREACEISATICLGQQYFSEHPDYNWCLHIAGTALPMSPGDMVVYRGLELEHWREPFSAGPGSYLVQAFLHYVDQDGPYRSYRYDQRPGLGFASATKNRSSRPRPSQKRREELESDFETWCYLRRVESTRARIANADFWRELCPDLTLTERPFDRLRAPYDIEPGEGDACLAALQSDGYFASSPIVPREDLDRLVAGAERVLQAGYPPGFAAVYDEFWRLYWGLDRLLAPLLGEEYLVVPRRLWLFLAPVGHPGGLLHAASPHRDSLLPDRHLLRTGRPGMLNIWIALTDATPENSCIYVLPAEADETYLTEARDLPGDIRLQDIRAVPAARGSVLGWTSHLVHWGSRSSARARGPRASAALYLQRKDLAPYYPDVFAFGDAVPFARRIEWIVDSMGRPFVSPAAIESGKP